MFGRNEFAVKPLYQDTIPEIPANCSLQVSLPYHIPDSVMRQFNFGNDSLMVIWFSGVNKETKRLSDKVASKFKTLNQLMLTPLTLKTLQWRNCVFFLKNSYDLILLDKNGVIRGQYASVDREEIDRLFIELDIILKKY